MFIMENTKLQIKALVKGNSIHFYTEYGRFYATKGNVKVKVPIVSAGSATVCPNADICPFHTKNYKEENAPECYACVSERIYPSVKESRSNNEHILREMTNAGKAFEFGKIVGEKLVDTCVKMGVKYVRFNESSDLADWNIEFFEGVSLILKSNNILPYTYSKSDHTLIERLIGLGVTVQKSEDDFVVVDSKEEAKEKGLVLCPGTACGTGCIRCPLNLKTAVLRH